MPTYSNFNPNPKLSFVNPLYLIRRRLFTTIQENAFHLRGTILDFGCGSKPYRNLFNVDEYIGIDIEISGHDHQQSEVDVFYDGKVIPFKDEHFDSVFCSEVFEHVFNLRDILKEINRVTKNDGKLMITIPFAWPEHEQPYDYARYTSFGITDLLKKHGYEIKILKKTGHFTEVILQQILLYGLLHCNPSNKILKALSRIFLFAPVYIWGRVCMFFLPKDDRYYHNLFILAQKVSA